MKIIEARKRLQEAAHPSRVAAMSKFFKTGPGEYAEGDRFIGAYVPEIRKIAKHFIDCSREEIRELLHSKIHEERFLSLIILIQQYRKSGAVEQEEIYRFYLENIDGINHWDLVDVSSPPIVGHYLLDKDKQDLFLWASSKNVWKRRMAVISTFYFIKKEQYDSTFQLAKRLLEDSHDLIHKAVGWMLREIGKRNLDLEIEFLETYAPHMPRTMLRYAIEKLSPKQRTQYLNRC